MHILYFYKHGCPFSERTHHTIIENFGRLNHQINKVCVDQNPQKYKDELSKQCGTKITTFPQIFVNNVHVGGYTDLQQWIGNGDMY